MATTMTEDAGAIRIALASGASGRLFAIPFLLVGGFLVYHLAFGRRLGLLTGLQVVDVRETERPSEE